MRIRKSDTKLCWEAEQEGRVASMTNILVGKITELNDELSSYFREKVPNYRGIFEEEDGEIVLEKINKYIKDKKIDKFKHPVDYPIEGSRIYLIPITDNLELKLMTVDEYYGFGDYSTYIEVSYFIINENTTKNDVDELINFVNEYIYK